MSQKKQKVKSQKKQKTGYLKKSRNMPQKEQKIIKKPEKRKTCKEKNPEDSYVFTQDWIPFEKAVYGMLKTKDGRYVKIVEIEPINFLLRTPEERADIIQDFYEWLKIAPAKLQFRMETVHTDSVRLIQNINQHMKDETGQQIKERKKELIEHIQRLSNTEALTKRFFIIYQYEGSEVDGSYSKDEIEIYHAMEYTKNNIKYYFTKMGNRVKDYDNENIFAADILYKEMNPKSSKTETLEQRISRIVSDEAMDAMMKNKELDVESISETNYTACRGLDFSHPDYVIKDGMYETYLYVRSKGYRAHVFSGWFENFTSFGEGVSVNLFSVKKNRFTTINRVKHAALMRKSEAGDKNRPTDEAETLLGAAANANFIKTMMADANEDLYDVCTMITIRCNTLKELREKKTQIKTTLRSKDYGMNDCLLHMEDACRMSLPLLCIEKTIFEKSKRNFLTSSLSSTYMYTAYEMYDEDGICIGLNGGNSSLVVPNPFNTKRFNNGNMVILGDSGMGKTYLLMTLSYCLRLMGIPVFCILPEKGHEWKKMCNQIGGTYIELAPGSNDRINIMAIHPQAKADMNMIDDYDEDDSSLLSKKIQQIITFIQLNMKKDDMNDKEETSISTCLTKLYGEFGITSDNDSIWEDKEKRILKKMPIIEDFYNKAKEDEILKERIAIILNLYVNGDAKNMNGQTNVNLDNKFIVISVSKAGKRMIAPFSFIAVDCCYDKIKADRSEKYALIMDEIWKMMINKSAAEFVMEIYKIIRGYAGLAVSATQNLKDLNNTVEGSNVLSLAKIKFILGMEKREADSIEELVDMSSFDKKRVEKFERGQALMISNGDKIPVNIKAPYEWDELFTTDPNRLKEIKERNRRLKGQAS